MEIRYRAFEKKWMYKVKCNVNEKVAQFKARWVVKGYLQQFEVD